MNIKTRIAMSSILVAGLGMGAQSASAADAAEAISLLPDAKPGQCFAKVREPARYETVTEQVVTSEAGNKIEIIPAKYTMVTETVIVKEASTKLVEVPATYESVSERIEVAPARTIWRTGKSSKSETAPSSLVAAALSAGLPAGADVGQCFSEYIQPARFESRPEQMLKRAASERIEIIPARYEWAEEQVLVKEASQKIVQVPAQYETVTERMLETPAHTVWKKGRGPIERVDHGTGEIMCLVEVPAKYKTLQKRVLKSPASTNTVTIPAEYKTVRVRKLASPAQEKRIEIPAEYQTVSRKAQLSDESITWLPSGSGGASSAGAGAKATGQTLCRAEVPAQFKTVTKQVVKTPATTQVIEIPAQTETVRVRKLGTPAQEKRIEIPAKYASVTRKVKTSDEKLSWKPVLCETNTSPQLVANIQDALKKAGHNPGPIDGILGRQTMAALDSYQASKGFARGGLTMNTLQGLGVSPR